MKTKNVVIKLFVVVIILLCIVVALALHSTHSDYPKFNADLFDRTKSQFKSGVTLQDDNKLLIQADTEMPGVTPAMVAWWFGEYMQTTDHYKSWYPDAHLWMDWENKNDGEIVGARHLVDEYVGDSLAQLRIEFVEPSTMIPGYKESVSRYAVCAFPGLRELPLATGIMCHDTQMTETGSVMRSVFHMGYIYKRDGEGNLTNSMPTLLNFAFVRNALIGEKFGNDLWDHAKTEMSILATFLPNIYSSK